MIDPATAELIASEGSKNRMFAAGSAAFSAALPYAVEGGRYLYDQAFGGVDENDPDFLANIAKLREAENQAYAPYEAFLGDELRRRAMASGRASGAALASQQGAGLTSFSPVNMLQAQQGEILAERHAGDIRREQALLPMQRFAEQQQAARDNIAAILASHSGEKARSSRLSRLGKAYEGTPGAALYGTAV